MAGGAAAATMPAWFSFVRVKPVKDIQREKVAVPEVAASVPGQNGSFQLREVNEEKEMEMVCVRAEKRDGKTVRYIPRQTAVLRGPGGAVWFYNLFDPHLVPHTSTNSNIFVYGLSVVRAEPARRGSTSGSNGGSGWRLYRGFGLRLTKQGVLEIDSQSPWEQLPVDNQGQVLIHSAPAASRVISGEMPRGMRPGVPMQLPPASAAHAEATEGGNEGAGGDEEGEHGGAAGKGAKRTASTGRTGTGTGSRSQSPSASKQGRAGAGSPSASPRQQRPAPRSPSPSNATRASTSSPSQRKDTRGRSPSPHSPASKTGRNKK